MKFWKKYSTETINEKIDNALKKTIDFENNKWLGFPVSKLDPNVFFNNIAFLGCHTDTDDNSKFIY